MVAPKVTAHVSRNYHMVLKHNTSPGGTKPRCCTYGKVHHVVASQYWYSTPPRTLLRGIVPRGNASCRRRYHVVLNHSTCITGVLYLEGQLPRGSAPCGNKYGTVPWDFEYGTHWFAIAQYYVVCTVVHITSALPWYSTMQYSGTVPYPKSHGALPGGKNVVLFIPVKKHGQP